MTAEYGGDQAELRRRLVEMLETDSDEKKEEALALARKSGIRLSTTLADIFGITSSNEVSGVDVTVLEAQQRSDSHEVPFIAEPLPVGKIHEVQSSGRVEATSNDVGESRVGPIGYGMNLSSNRPLEEPPVDMKVRIMSERRAKHRKRYAQKSTEKREPRSHHFDVGPAKGRHNKTDSHALSRNPTYVPRVSESNTSNVVDSRSGPLRSSQKLRLRSAFTGAKRLVRGQMSANVPLIFGQDIDRSHNGMSQTRLIKTGDARHPLGVTYEEMREMRSPQFYTLNQGRCFAEPGVATKVSAKERFLSPQQVLRPLLETPTHAPPRLSNKLNMQSGALLSASSTSPSNVAFPINRLGKTIEESKEAARSSINDGLGVIGNVKK
jgi:hypothetical protein